MHSGKQSSRTQLMMSSSENKFTSDEGRSLSRWFSRLLPFGLRIPCYGSYPIASVLSFCMHRSAMLSPLAWGRYLLRLGACCTGLLDLSCPFSVSLDLHFLLALGNLFVFALVLITRSFCIRLYIQSPWLR